MENKNMPRLANGILFVAVLSVGIFGMAKNSQAQTDFYIAQTAQNLDNGTNCANAHAITWFNTASNWQTSKTTLKIGAGDTVHFCGTLSTTATVQASGSSGSPITILFESGAKLSKAYWGNGANSAIYFPSVSYITIDGGTNGIIECTNNGTDYANKQNPTAMYMSGGSYLEVKNLTVQNLYVRTNTTDELPEAFGATGSASVYADGNHTGLSFHSNTFNHSVGGIIISGGTVSGTSIYNNAFSHIDHNIAMYGGSSSSIANTSIYNNQFADYYNWDDTLNNYYHHNALHFFTDGSADGLYLYNNTFTGDVGDYVTSHFYIEDPNGTGSFNHVYIYNNLFPASSNGHDPWGAIVVMGVANSIIANNTIFGNKTNGTGGILLEGGTKNYVAVENNVITGQNYAIAHFYSNTPNVTYDNNLYYNNDYIGNVYGGSGYDALGNWQTYLGGCPNVGNECNSLAANPGLTSSGIPSVSSATVDSGKSLTSYFTTDYAGLARPQGSAWDIGAFEYASGGGDTTPPAAPAGLSVS